MTIKLPRDHEIGPWPSKPAEVAKLMLSVSLVWPVAELLCAFVAPSALSRVLLYFNGPAAGICACGISMQMRTRSATYTALLFLLAGASLVFWAPAAAYFVEQLVEPIVNTRQNAYDWPMLLSVSGLIFACLTTLATWALLPLVVMASVLTAWWVLYAALPVTDPVLTTTSAATLNLAVFLPLYYYARRDIEQRTRASTQRCEACDYDLTGISSRVCPECGTSTAPPDDD